MRFLADDDDDEGEHAEMYKAAPLVDAQTVTITMAMSKARRWRRWRKFDNYLLRNRAQTPAWNLASHATQTPVSPNISSFLASTNKDKRLEVIDKEVSALEDAGT
jgi:hypothetical protein